MVRKIVGYDNAGKKVFERDARSYDEGIGHIRFGITFADVLKVIPVFILIITVYVNQQNFNVQLLNISNSNSKSIMNITNVLGNLNNYLSSTTGKQFKDGRPY